MPTRDIVRINDIIEQVVSYYPEADQDLLRRAYVFSAKVHHGQTRLSGEPYLNHPLSVASILVTLNLDEYAIATGLLHDTVEDTYTTIKEIEALFGREVAFLVDGVTKISKIASTGGSDSQAESFRKMFLAMSKDIRVLLVKLADRVHNMRTLEYLPPDRQKKTAQETLDIYAPLANRLGLFLIKRELEDLSLKFLHEKIYQEIDANLVVTAEQREKYVREVISVIDKKLRQFGIGASITGRPKHVFSIYNKMLQQNLNFNEIYDLLAFRIIVRERKECYEVLGIIHSIWKPIPGRFKDYISLPKANMYQSLHTAVIGPYGQRIELQIRTEEMDKVAKHGIAAHWKYKEGRMIDQKDDERFVWLQQVIESQSDVKDSRELLEAFRVDIFPDEVYVFTPKGAVIELPKGSTPVDFAYRIHTDVGHKCVGARVNGAMVPLRHELKSGDVVQIMTMAAHKPSRDWLKFVKTSRAQTKIRQWIKHQELEGSVALGREICEKEFRKYRLAFPDLLKDPGLLGAFAKEGVKDLEDLFAAVGQGRIKVRHVINRLLPKEELEEVFEKKLKESAAPAVRKGGAGIRIDGMDDIMVRFGRCCSPIPGDKVKGFITRGRGVTVHAVGCSFLQVADPERVIEAQWNEACSYVATVPIEVICADKKGLLAEITSSISAMEANIINAQVKTTPDRKAISIFELEIHGLKQLEAVMQTIKGVRGVLKVTRLRPQG